MEAVEGSIYTYMGKYTASQEYLTKQFNGHT